MEAERLHRSEEMRRERFAQLTGASRAILHAVAMRYCSRDSAAADDLLQDTFERAWRSLESLQDTSKAVPWLVTIMRNCWIDACRKRARHREVFEVPEQTTSTDEPSRWQRVTVDDFHRAVEQLAEPYHSAVIMHDIDRLSNREISQRLGVPYATVATRVHRAHRKLESLLQIALDAKEE
jgi:RNA polymerase sigma-70 factor (ECF subfamily)